MEEKERKDASGNNAPLDYEGLLNGFVTDDVPERESMALPDLDGLAINELLGGEPASENATFIPRYDVAGETGEYAELARQFEDLDLGALDGDGAAGEVGDSGDISAPSAEENDDYTFLLGRLGGEDEPKPAPPAETDLGKEAAGRLRSGILDFMDLPPLEGGEPSREGEEPPVSRKMFGEVNLADDFLGTEEPSESPGNADVPIDGLLVDEPEPESVNTVAAVAPPENAPVILSPEKKPDDDFLGLSGIPGAGASPKPASLHMETLFDGVEMDFYDQTAQVTLAELLLAQGNRKEAADIFQEVALRKGVTNWVASRLRLLSTTAEK